MMTNTDREKARENMSVREANEDYIKEKINVAEHELVELRAELKYARDQRLYGRYRDLSFDDKLRLIELVKVDIGEYPDERDTEY